MLEALRPNRVLPARIAAFLVLALLADPPGPRAAPSEPESQEMEARRVVESVTEGRWAALALRDGRVIVYDIVEGRRHEWDAPAEPVRSMALDPMGISAVPRHRAGIPPAEGEAPVVLISVAGPDIEETTLHVVRGDDGLSLLELRIPGEPVALLVAPGEGRAYVITAAAARGRGEASDRMGRWTLRSVDLATAKVEATLTHDGTVHSATLSAEGDRLYVALDDSIRSFATRPLRSSWMLRSPGRNLLIEPVGTAGAIVAIRDSELALLNPDNLPGRDRPPGDAADDDAILVVELPYIGRHIDVNDRTSEAVVLDARGTRLATVDLERGEVTGIQQVPEVAAAIYHPDRDTLVLFQVYAQRVFEMAHEPPDREAAGSESLASVEQPPIPSASSPVSHSPAAVPTAASPPPAGARGSGAAAVPIDPNDPGSTGNDPEAGALATAPPAATADAAGDPGASRESGGPPSPEAPAGDDLVRAAPAAGPPPARTPAEPILMPEPATPTDPSAEAGSDVMAGRITGELGLVEAVVFYGPDALLREHARITPDADGAFSLNEAPPGRYRVVVVGPAGVQLRCSPPVRVFLAGSGRIPPLDFQVTGQVQGRLEP